MNFPSLCSCILFLAIINDCYGSFPFAQRYEELIPVEQTVYSYGTPATYKFSYNTGGDQGVSDVAQHFREESRDESGFVVGKYGYVDPYGKLRVVSYRAGPDGYHVDGDIGPDQEVVRQQREQYTNDQSYLIQQQAWQQVANGGQQAVSNYGTQQQTASSSAGASSNTAASNGGTEWTSVNGVNQQGSTSSDYTTKGRNQFAERYTAVGGVKSPAAQLRETTTTSVKTIKTNEVSGSTAASSASAAAASSAAASSSAYTQPAPAVAYTQTTYSTKSVPAVQQTAAIKQYAYSYQIPTQTVIHQVVKPARIVAVKEVKTVQQQPYTTVFQSPAARLVAINTGTSSSSASASAAASASASTSGAYTAGVKGYSGAIKTAPYKAAPLKVARYAVGGPTVVHFQQGGPTPFKYSYSY